MGGWYRIISHGWISGRTGATVETPHGVYRSREEAKEALAAWAERHIPADQWGAVKQAHGIHVAGPFATRAHALRADASIA